MATWTPSIVPQPMMIMTSTSWSTTSGATVGYRETDVEDTDRETVIRDLLDGQYKNPVRLVAFNTAERWSRDVSADVAHELRQRCNEQMRDVPFGLEEFMDRHEGRYHDIQLPLPLRLV